jgi:VWFA-related protein
VTVDVEVSNPDGSPVADLTQNDFLVYEDDTLQQIRSFSPVSAPYSVMLLLDRSQSMEDYWGLMEPAASRFLAGLRSQDRVAVAAFDERSPKVDLLLGWRDARTGVPVEIAINPMIRGNAVYGVSGPTGGSASIRTPKKDLYRALEWAAEQVGPISGRRGVLVFTDGIQPGAPAEIVDLGGTRSGRLRDPHDDNDFQRLLRVVQKTGAPFYFVAVNTDLNLARVKFLPDAINTGMPVRARLEQLASASGGRVALPSRVEDTLKVYESIAHDLGTSYTLSYTPSHPVENGVYRSIKVATRKPGLIVRQSRDRYTIR